MRNKQGHQEDPYSSYNAITEPFPTSITAPIPITHFPQESWSERFLRGVRMFLVALVRKINQLLSLGLAVLVLLLLTHFLLTFFGITTGLFTLWVSFICAPLLFPFNNMVPPLLYSGYIIDSSTLIAIVVYIIVVTVIRKFLKVLVA